MRLLFDEMLEKTARWARLFGVNSLIAKGDDSKILDLASSTRRILVTRDKQLAARCKKIGVRCFFIKSVVLATQLYEIEKAAGKKIFSFPKKTRCPACNGRLAIVAKQKVAEKVPRLVYRSHKKFWFCKQCKKVYWQGGHWKNITGVYGALKTRLRRVLFSKALSRGGRSEAISLSSKTRLRRRNRVKKERK